jgi:uncharacterized protein (TIGR03067 family)
MRAHVSDRLAGASAGKLWSNRNMVSRIRGVFVFAILGLCLALAMGGCAKKDDAAQKRERELRKQQIIQDDYDALTGRWQLVYAVENGRELSGAELRDNVLITDHDKFRFPNDSTAGTAPRGHFTIDPTKHPKRVDSTSATGPYAGKVSRGIYEILDPNTKRACWAMPGDPRPDDFVAPLGSGRTLQYWRLVSKNVGEELNH